MATWKKIITSGSNAELNHISASGNIIPITTDGSSLGSVSHNFSDLFLDSGAVINLDGGDVTLTHSSNKLTLAGGSLDVDGGIAIDNITIDANEIDLSSGDLTIDVASDIILDAAGKDISMTDGSGTAEFIFNLEDAPELDVDGDFTIDGSGKITLDSATTNINLIGNVTASGVVSASAGFIGGLTGTADVATVATTVTITDNEDTDEDNAIVFTAGGDVDGGNIGLESDGTLNYNPSSGKLTATQLAGTLQTAAQTNITSVGALDGGSISSNFGAIDNGASAITTTGTVSAGRVNTTGGVHVGGTADPGTDNLIVDGTTILTGNVTASANVSGSNTSTASFGYFTGSFFGDGSGLTGTSGAVSAVANGANNRIATFSSTDALNGEANLTFDGTNLLIGGSGKLYLNDAGGEHISGDGSILSIAGGNEIDLTATSIDINGDVDISGNTVIGGNLTVNGTTTTVATTNLDVKDQFILLASGSSGTNVDAGILAQSGSVPGSGSGLYHDIDVVAKTNPNGGRWSVAKGLAHNHTSATPTQFVTTVKTDTINPDATSGSYGAGEMHVNTTSGEIWIRYE